MPPPVTQCNGQKPPLDPGSAPFSRLPRDRCVPVCLTPVTERIRFLDKLPVHDDVAVFYPIEARGTRSKGFILRHAAQLLHVNLPQCSPLRKGGLLLHGGQLTARLPRHRCP